MRIRVMFLSLLIVGSALSGAEASAAGPKPLRTGTIEGGTGVVFAGEQPAGERWGCAYAVDCQAWLQSGCNPALAGHDPVLTASIVDVRALADGRAHRSFQWSAPAKVHPGAVIQFWRRNCTELSKADRHTLELDEGCESRQMPPDGVTRCGPLRIPRGARWMTVSGYWTTVHLTWTLT